MNQVKIISFGKRMNEGFLKKASGAISGAVKGAVKGAKAGVKGREVEETPPPFKSKLPRMSPKRLAIL